ncbi:hypothetical protein I6A60_26745 [Frankia sp. AgB1.9]|uniref:hypothetical protein n=1 Tax=unclassified Frankia TaxID=2632575 RepID=UPI0019311786|nr:MULTISPECIES: hypothetical protein [unclassified Frankia]MBL7488593.1 hypothetical protein [Frankia sp. AgW1.1]MBL7551429.1 hypothetical protein [Frankia sp. AgB1.9]MBL7622683.1 hypothetical protein [Frankia sp. AgB1.8]
MVSAVVDNPALIGTAVTEAKFAIRGEEVGGTSFGFPGPPGGALGGQHPMLGSPGR